MPRMAKTETLFATPLYRAPLAPGKTATPLLRELEAACLSIAAGDRAGQAWSREKRYAGYTSYASLDDLAWRDPSFRALQTHLDRHARAFARTLAFDLGRGRLVCNALWINVLEPGGTHSGHIHPHSVLSGTVYVRVPKNASAIRFEDPRLPQMMAAPPRKETAPRALQQFVSVEPRPGDVLLWESFLRHEVPPNGAKTARISVSFNYSLT
jgi:uncharacterized protein (TIGR02466 family)